MSQLGGVVNVKSTGRHQGVTFVLEFPLPKPTAGRPVPHLNGKRPTVNAIIPDRLSNLWTGTRFA